ncbi:hypothetical protein HNR42_002803 [Deinobacterium chartae]|uniref:Uncharacterized protein n=1 Tax=Deinobacterium chartae TaxID=521158 RepID=A0A841I616_9DEIO|nr:hypothetical protein [Deinobacterium chartae]MBB6099362.1 hypothetical protein [Deinobacterium chartae]
MNKALLGLLTCLWSSGALAGQCREIRPFAQAAQQTPLVVQATVVKRAQTRGAPGFIEVRVQRVLKGQAPRTLRVLDPDGLLPAPSASALPVGTTWVLALAPGKDRGTYVFPPCATTILAVLGKQVFGNVYGGWDVILPLNDLKNSLERR